MNVADYLIKRLEELGVNDFFGLPGDYNFNIISAVNTNPNTNWIGSTNELNAGYAADGYARMRGYGAIITTYGVGELSAINAIAGSMAEYVPVVSIVGIPSTKNIAEKKCVHHNLHEVNYHAYYEAYKALTNAQAFLTRDNAKMEIDRVLQVLVKEKQPVYIAIPMDIATMEISDKEISYDWESDKETLRVVTDKIVEKINKAQKPVILGDVLIKRFDSRIEYKEFVETTKIPTTNFLMGTNLIDMDSENYLGGYLGELFNPIAKKYLHETDCLIAVGSIYSDINSFGFNLPYKINSHIAIYGTHTYIDSVRYDNIKMNDVLDSITPLIEPREISFEKQNIGYELKEPTMEPLSSSYIYPRLQEFIKENDIVLAETGVITHGIASMKFPVNAEVQTQSLWASIGWATPATLGVCLAKPNSRVILLTGEGSFQLTAMELGNMLRRGIKPVIIVLNNNGYTIERILCDNPDDKFNDVMNMNYSKFSRVFEGDVWATSVKTEDDFDKSLKVTQIMDKLCYLEICTAQIDTPEITTKLIESFKNKSKNIQPIKTTTPVEIPIDTYSTKTKNSYETVIHKALGGIDE